MPAAENPKVGGCYIWVISFLLFVFTVAGAVFLVLYITQPESSSASWYPIIGVTLVFLPWFFWIFTILYRIVSRNCGFRMMCFGRSTSFSDNNGGVPPPQGGGGGPANGGASPRHRSSVDGNSGGGAAGRSSTEDVLLNVDGNGNGNEVPRQVGSPRRVHFGGTVILGEGGSGANEDHENPRSPSSSSSSSFSSMSSRHTNESELPLKLLMGS